MRLLSIPSPNGEGGKLARMILRHGTLSLDGFMAGVARNKLIVFGANLARTSPIH